MSKDKANANANAGGTWLGGASWATPSLHQLWQTLVPTLGALVLVLLLAYLLYRRLSRRNRGRFVVVAVPAADGKKRERLRLPVQRWVRIGHYDPSASALLLSYGTRGDVEPLIAFADRLQRIGLKPRLCAPTCFRDLVEGADVPFESIGVDEVDQPPEVFAQENGSIADVLGVLAKVYPQLAEGCLRAAERERVSVIVCTALTRSIAMHVAEKLRVPCLCVHFVASDVPTRAFPPCEYMGISRRALRTLPSSVHGLFNKALYSWRGLQIVRAAVSTGLAAADGHFRTKVADLRAADALQSLTDVTAQPAFHAYAERVQPRPADWPSNAMVCGFWRRAQTQDSVPEALASFMRAQPRDRLVIVTFGSMQIPDELREAVVQAALAESCSVVVCAPREPGQDVTIENKGPKLLYVRTSIPYDVVFPRCACVVHHGGAGTSASALYAGTPSLVIPILRWSDQPYWASRLDAIGCGVHVPRNSLATDEALRRGIRRSLQSHVHARAQAVRKRLKASLDGASIAAAILKQYCEELS
ncbi:Sterol 3-beta-glucosyltransferase [Hondaea fermentalgiana]|uniref:Sterol 3-beta-glucosyltransferase n=1 Tax=Hondaea fermentalgiana TaxID=2315210 RepID=A0A2R5GNE0_9STRA|nr:Sterol 3-beta-glucosyltransferase [Hondaea fermentalgiana]|eukprot:GBG29821.1 Sterol 3-beta-glucosyltransferase [Hondaea fermentalgiana]